MLGDDNSCCGSDTQSGGCGKCALIRVSSATNAEWTALIMKKNRCPPNSNGCEAGNVHFDVAVPGYDNLQYSTANVCGERSGTGFASRQDSAVLGDWYETFTNTAQAASRCSNLPAQFQKGCQLFSEWGWTRGDPGAEFQVVECPAAFKNYVADRFDANGVVDFTDDSTDTPVTDTPVTDTPVVSTDAPVVSTDAPVTGDGACFISQCGCPDAFKESWCTVESHEMQDTFCGQNQQNCETCNGAWCPYDGPGDSLTTTTPIQSSEETTAPPPTSDTFVQLDFDQGSSVADFTAQNAVQIEDSSLRFETSTANFGNGFLKSNFAIPGNHWGRVWMKLDSSSLTANLGHWVAVAGGVGSNQIRLMDLNSNEAGKVVFQLGWQDDSFQKVTSWSNKYDLSSEWTCYEWHMDPNAQTFDFYVSGTPVVWDSPQNIGSGVPAGRDLPQNLDWIGFGVESFGGAATTIGGNFDDIVVSANRVGCGSPPTTATLAPTTMAPETTLAQDCGYIPETCSKPLQRTFGKLDSKTYKKFEEITGVSQSEATIEDMQLYFYCKRKSNSKCIGLEAPCTCSVRPCVCDRTVVTEPATLSPTGMPTKEPSMSPTENPTTAAGTANTMSPTESPTTAAGNANRCALSACGCSLQGQSWCNAQNSWLATEWCHQQPGNCQGCGGVWCDPLRRLLKQN